MKKLCSYVIAFVMICASLAGLSAFAVGFSDVEAGRWSEASIGYAVENGYMKGVGGGKFDPEGSLTRAMVATVLWRREGEPKPGAASGFSDVPSGEWYSDAVAWAKETGVVKGVTDKTFEPDGLITREQLATMLFRFASSNVPDGGGRGDLSVFADSAKVSDWAREPLEWAVDAGLIKGTDGNRLAPDGNATREQFAAIIERFDSYAENAESPLVRADFYVSPNGDDSWSGSFSRPFRTIGRAVLAVRDTEKTAERGGITVAVRGGEYCLFDLTLSAIDSGTEECPVSYIEYGDGDVVITDRFEVGADSFGELDPEETEFFGKAASHIKKADVSGVFPKNETISSYRVTTESGELWAARYPDRYDDGEETFFPGAVSVSGPTTVYLNNSLMGKRLARYRSLDGVMICGDICYSVFFENIEVGAYDAETRTATVAHPREIRSYDWFGGFRYVENGDGTVDTEKTRVGVEAYIAGAAEELDKPNEFWVDAKSGILYVYEPTGPIAFEADEPPYDSMAEYVTFFGDLIGSDSGKEYETPIVYLDKEGDGGFRVLNISDPQLDDAEWDGNAGRIVTETVLELVRTESPDLITVSGDLAWGSSFVSCAKLADLLAETGVPWAFVLGNHDHEIDDEGLAEKIEILKSREGCLFEWGDPDLGCGNYVIVLRRNGVPVHGVIMMDSHSYISFIDEEGDAHSGYADFTDEQIGWYGDVCDMLTETGVTETTMICHIPCYTYRDAFEAAFLPGIDPKTVPAGDGLQVGCWAPGYEDSFGVLHESGIASADRDNGFFEAVLAHGSTKTLIAGHDHINSFSISYRGVRCVYSLKTGPGCYWEAEMSGGTLIDISPEGNATVRHHYVSIDLS